MIKLRHVSWNLAGLLLPLAVAAFTVPHLLQQLGAERFGLLALAWGVVGYAGVLDLGLGRAVTQYTAALTDQQFQQEGPSVLKSAAWLTAISGTAVGGLLSLIGYWTIGDWFKTKDVTLAELQLSVLCIAAVLPVQAMSATYRGLCEARQRFVGINMMRIALGAITFGGPALALLFSQSLVLPIVILVVARLVALGVFRTLALRCFDTQCSAAILDMTLVRRLFVFGSWVTVSNLLSPVMMQADRFVIGIVISAAAVGVYVIPYEMVAQSLVLVGAVSATVFPAFGRLLAEQPTLLSSYFQLWLKRVALMMSAVSVGLAGLLPWILPWWLGDAASAQMVSVGQILCIGVFANSLAAMYYALLHAHGRADITAKCHMLELPIFLLLLLGLVNYIGLVGAAIAWSGRMLLDMLLLRHVVRTRYV